MRSEASSLHASEPVVSLITWRPQAWERRLSLRVDSRSQRKRCSNAGTFVARDNKLAISVQTPFLRFRQCGSCRPQVISFCGRVGRIQLRGLAKGGGRRRRQTLRATDAPGEGAASRVVRSGAQGKRPTRGGRKCENVLELRGKRAPAEFPGQAMHGALRAAGAREVGLCPDEIEHTGQQETALWARWGAHRERVDADA